MHLFHQWGNWKTLEGVCQQERVCLKCGVLKCREIDHRWSKWEEFDERRGKYIGFLDKTIYFTARMQRRECLQCGFVQVQQIEEEY